jgi:drug/metabolite transporter (DMT)-like permease
VPIFARGEIQPGHTLLGYLVFGDVPDAMMVLGASIIVLSGLYAFYRERIRHRALAAESSGFPPDGL